MFIKQVQGLQLNLNNKVPYIGATSSLNLGTQSIVIGSTITHNNTTGAVPTYNFQSYGVSLNTANIKYFALTDTARDTANELFSVDANSNGNTIVTLNARGSNSILNIFNGNAGLSITSGQGDRSILTQSNGISVSTPSFYSENGSTLGTPSRGWSSLYLASGTRGIEQVADSSAVFIIRSGATRDDGLNNLDSLIIKPTVTYTNTNYLSVLDSSNTRLWSVGPGGKMLVGGTSFANSTMLTLKGMGSTNANYAARFFQNDGVTESFSVKDDGSGNFRGSLVIGNTTGATPTYLSQIYGIAKGVGTVNYLGITDTGSGVELFHISSNISGATSVAIDSSNGGSSLNIWSNGAGLKISNGSGDIGIFTHALGIGFNTPYLYPLSGGGATSLGLPNRGFNMLYMEGNQCGIIQGTNGGGYILLQSGATRDDGVGADAIQIRPTVSYVNTNYFSIQDGSYNRLLTVGPSGKVLISGSVGIGTTSPLAKLDVYGPSGITSFQSSTLLGMLVRGSTSTNDYSGIDFSGNSGITTYARIGVVSTNLGTYIKLGTSNSYGVGITNTAVSIDYGGRTGFNTDPVANSIVTIKGSGSTTSTFSQKILQSDGITLTYTLDDVGNGFYRNGVTSPNLTITNNANITGTVSSAMMTVFNSDPNGYAAYFSSVANFTAGAASNAVFHTNYGGPSANTIQNALLLRNGSSGTASAGIGSAISFLTKNSTTSNFQSGNISHSLSTVTTGLEDSRFDFYTVTGGASVNNPFRIVKNQVSIGVDPFTSTDFTIRGSGNTNTTFAQKIFNLNSLLLHSLDNIGNAYFNGIITSNSGISSFTNLNISTTGGTSLEFTGSSTYLSPNRSRIWNDSSDGLAFQTKAGSSSEMIFINSSGTTIFRVLTGTQDVLFRGKASIGFQGNTLPINTQLTLRGSTTGSSGLAGSSTNAYLINGLQSDESTQSFYVSDRGELNIKDSYWLNGYKFIHTTGTQNLFMGTNAGINSTGVRNTFIGAYGLANSSGSYNVGIGSNVLANLTTGYANIAVGDGSLLNLTTGYNNLSIGYNTKLTTGFNTVMVGGVASSVDGTSSDWVCIGYSSVISSSATSIKSVVIGGTGTGSGSGSAGLRSITIGYDARNYGFNDVVNIGSESYANGNNSISIGNTLYSGQLKALNNSIVMGGGTTPMTQFIFGTYDASNISTNTFTFRTADPYNFASDRAGHNLRIASGLSTGAGLGGNIIFSTSTSGVSGTASNTLVDRLTISPTAITSASDIIMSGDRSIYSQSTSGGSIRFYPGGGGGNDSIIIRAGGSNPIRLQSNINFDASGNGSSIYSSDIAFMTFYANGFDGFASPVLRTYANAISLEGTTKAIISRNGIEMRIDSSDLSTGEYFRWSKDTGTELMRLSEGGTLLLTGFGASTNKVIRTVQADTITESFSVTDKGELNVNDSYFLNGNKFLHFNGTSIDSANTFIGKVSGLLNTGTSNTSIGWGSMYVVNSGSDNTASGYRAMWSLTTGTYNVAFGSESLGANISSSYNTAIGYAAGNTTTGPFNTLIGARSGQGLTSGGGNISIGYNSGIRLSAGNYNTLIGSYSGSHTSVPLNINGTIAIGYDTRPTKSNQLLIGGDYPYGNINEFVIGANTENVNVGTVLFKTTNGLGNNVNGWNLTLAAGLSTGNAIGGDIKIQTTSSSISGSSLNNYVDRITIKGGNGYIGINNNNPTVQLDIVGTLLLTGFGAGSNKVIRTLQGDAFTESFSVDDSGNGYFKGIVNVTTPPINDNSTKVATTAWTQAAINSAITPAIKLFNYYNYI